MKMADNIEKLIRDSRVLDVNTNAETDRRILGDALKVQEQMKKTKSAPSRPIVWRIIMKSRITKFATVAVIIIAVVIGINQFGGSIDVASVAWADVVRVINNISIFHWVCTVEKQDGTSIPSVAEYWMDLKKGQSFSTQKSENFVQCVKIDGPTNTLERYVSETHTLYRMELGEKSAALVPQGDFLDYLFRIFAIVPLPQSEWQQSASSVQAHTTFVRDLKWDDGRTGRISIEVDNTNRKPSSMNIRLHYPDNMERNMRINIQFDYPETMPMSFTDVGIDMKDVTIVESRADPTKDK